MAINLPSTKNLFLIDGHAVVYKYFYAYAKNPLRTATGEITSATFGLSQMIAILLKHYPLSHIAVIFDPPHGSWRKEVYSAYKAGRKKDDVDMSPILLRAFETVKTWGIYTNAFARWEADDIIGSLAALAASEGYDAYIISKDKDFCQLIGDHVKMLSTGEKISADDHLLIDAAKVKEIHNVEPSQMRDYLAIMGDTADNIPGVKGVGKKTASDLLCKFGDIAGIYENLDSLTKAQKAKFEADKEDLVLWRDLVTIRDNVNTGITMDDLRRPAANHNEELITLFQELEFYSVIKTLCD